MIQKSEYNFRIRTPPEIFSNYRNNKILNSLLTIQVGLQRSNDFIFLLLVSESLIDINIRGNNLHSVSALQSTLWAMKKQTYRVLCKSIFTWFTEYSVKHPKIDLQITL